MSYTPRYGTDTHRMLAYLVEHAPFQSDKWVLSKTLAEAAKLESQMAVHTLLNQSVTRGCVRKELRDERLRWQAGPDAVDALKRCEAVQALTPMGFPNAKEREPVEFRPREGGSMDKAHQRLKALGEGESIAEDALLRLLELPDGTDLRVLFKPAIEAGAFDYLMVPNGTTIERRWQLGDGHPPHAETSPPARGYTRPRKASAKPPPAEPARVVPLAPAAAPPESRNVVSDLAALPLPAGIGHLPFRCGIFSNGVLTIQKDHGVVELSQEETLELFEHISPYALRAKR